MGENDDKARLFASLHRPGEPLILYNAWDAGSAKVIAEAGAKAIGTGSYSVAMAHGYDDREALPLDLALANAERIVNAVELPVTIDFEGAYAYGSVELGENARRLVETGAIGCNFEDQVVGTDRLYEVAEQAARITALRNGAGENFFI